MPIFRSIVFSAALAGLIVGAVTSVAQFLGTVPLIQKSEVYERKAAPEAPPAAHEHAGAAHHHDNAGSNDSEWGPEDGFQRNAFTVAANILTAIGFALLLTGIYAIRGRPVMWREGLLWGLGGFVVFTAALGLGLLALPHLIGAPLAPESHSEVPAALSHRFVVVVTLTSLLFWGLLGVSTSIAFGRISRPLDRDSASLANSTH